jgi:hypothetical protein
MSLAPLKGGTARIRTDISSIVVQNTIEYSKGEEIYIPIGPITPAYLLIQYGTLDYDDLYLSINMQSGYFLLLLCFY